MRECSQADQFQSGFGRFAFCNLAFVCPAGGDRFPVDSDFDLKTGIVIGARNGKNPVFRLTAESLLGVFLKIPFGIQVRKQIRRIRITLQKQSEKYFRARSARVS